MKSYILHYQCKRFFSYLLIAILSFFWSSQSFVVALSLPFDAGEYLVSQGDTMIMNGLLSQWWWRRLPALPTGTPKDIVMKGIKNGTIIPIATHDFVDTIVSFATAVNHTLYDTYLWYGDEVHRVVALVGSDKKLFVLYSDEETKKTLSKTWEEYLASYPQSEQLQLFIFHQWYNPSIVEKTVALTHDRVWTQSGVRVHASAQQIKLEDRGWDSNFSSPDDFVVKKLSDQKIIVGDEYAHLEFAKPVQVQMDVQAKEGSNVEVQVLHEWDESYGTRGITMNPNATCHNGISSDEWATTKVQDGKVVFYTCGASTFVVDFGLQAGWGLNGTVNMTLVQPDGKILLGGSFTGFNNQTVNRIVRLTSTGWHDTGFLIWSSFNNTVNTMVLQPDGKILVWWTFTSYSWFTSNRLIRLNADGTRDTGFVVGSAFNNTVSSLSLQPDGKVLVGWSFTSYSWFATNRIIRLTSTGERDTSFVAWSAFNNTVTTMAVQSDGKILVWWAFTTYSWTTTNRILRISATGSYDTSFVIGSGFNNTVNTIVIQPDGKILVGWVFTNYAWSALNRIARLTSWGLVDTGFIVGSAFNNTVTTLALQSDGMVLVWGSFGTYSWVSQNFISRLTSTGARDTSFVIGAAFTNTVMSIALQTDNKIVVGWWFIAYNGLVESRITRLLPSAAKDPTFLGGAGPDTIVSTLALQSDGKILLWWSFTNYNRSPINRMLRVGSDGIQDSWFVLWSGFNNTVSALAVQSDGNMIVWWAFTTYSWVAANRIVRLTSTGARDPTFSIGTAFNGAVSALALQPDGKILVGWSFTSYSWFATNRIVRLTSTGARDPTFSIGTAFNGTVSALALQPDGKIVAWWSFTSYSWFATNRIIRLTSTGARDTSFAPWSAFNNTVNTLAVHPDGAIVVWWSFTSYSGLAQNRITRVLSGGLKDPTFGIGSAFNSTVNTLALQPDGKILAWWSFTSYSGLSQNRITRITTNGLRDSSFVIGWWFDNTVNSILVQSDGKILVWWSFTNFNGTSYHNFVRLLTASAPTIIAPFSGQVLTYNTVTVSGTGQAGGIINLTLSGAGTKTGLITNTGYWSIPFTGLSNGTKLLSGFVTVSWSTSDIVTRTFTVSMGSLCIESPTIILTGVTALGSSQTIELQTDYFKVLDRRGRNSWYYTTLSMNSLTWISGSVISNTAIQRKADPIVLLSGSANPLVSLGSAFAAYTGANLTQTFIKRDPDLTGGVLGEYGSQLRIKITVPAYQRISSYTGTMTYTLYEN